ncbi:ROK family protein [Candidatus Pacearchaeota archaeon]|nr:ROK family protein [Candidatus Pacearchaeota archaeon]
MGVDKIIAIDLGGTNLRVSLVEKNCIVEYHKEKTPKTQNEILEKMCEMISSLMDKDVIGIGVSSPGPLQDGIIKNPPNLPIRNFDLKKYLVKRFKIHVEVENDANCVALAEARMGVRKRNIIVITLGTGVGGGVIMNNELYLGQGYGGELGHIVLHNGKDLETLWQEKAKLIKKYFKKDMYVSEVLKKGGPNAKIILDYLATYIGQGVGSLVNVFDPELVVLTGGVRECGSKLLKPIQQKVYEYSKLPRKTKIVWSRLDHPGSLGASLLVRNRN